MTTMNEVAVKSGYVIAGGIRTHYLEAGHGRTVVLLHSGEFGGAAELSWEVTLPVLAQHFHVIAPDYLGYGRSDKLRDFGSHGARVINHITAFLETVCITRADFIGNSVSGRWLCRVASERPVRWPIRRMVCISGGGAEPLNEERRRLQDYDGSPESMRSVLAVLFHDDRWLGDDYVDRRQEFAHMPGAWSVAAAARFRAPWEPERPMFGRADTTNYERIEVPTLFVAGTRDRLLPDRYWAELVERTPQGEALAVEDAAHCPHLERPDEVNEAIIEFLLRPDDGQT